MRTIGLSEKGKVTGEYHYRSKLSLAKVEEMRRLRVEEGRPYKEICKIFGVSRSAAARAINGVTWAAPPVRTVQQIEADDLTTFAQGEGRRLIAKKAGVTVGSVSRAMKRAGITWDGIKRPALIETSNVEVLQKTVAVNEAGLRIGEDHHNAKYTNGEIEMVLSLRDEGKSYGQIAKLTEMPKSTVRDIIKGRRRCQYPASFKTIKE